MHKNKRVRQATEWEEILMNPKNDKGSQKDALHTH